MSEVRVDTINEKTAGSGLSIDDNTIISGGLFVQPKDITTVTVASDEASFAVSGANITGTVTVAGVLRIVQ
jgi:hypothetical protein